MSDLRRLEIWGGGLAGLSLGLALARRGWPILLREKGAYPRHRVCGEFVCGVSDAVLSRLGLEEILMSAEPLHGMSWFHRGEEVYRGGLSISARGISRFQLDQALADAFRRAGGELRQHERCDLKKLPAEGVVLTAGRPARPDGPWMGLKCHLLDFEIRDDLEMHLGPGGYVGLSRIEDGKVNLCGLFRRRDGLRGAMPDLFREYLKALGAEELVERMSKAEIDPNSCQAVAGFVTGQQALSERVMALGDAREMIPPFTGNGMSMAFESASLAIDPIEAYLRGRLGWGEALRAVRGNLEEQFRHRMSLAAALHPLLLNRWSGHLAALVARLGLLPVQGLFRSLRLS